jgi:hypothetical protein
VNADVASLHESPVAETVSIWVRLL